MTSRSVTPNQIIASAERLLAAGKAAEAQELLLDEGYMKRSEPRIQQAYLRLIPVSPTLRAMLDEVYNHLDDPSSKVRFEAATRLSREFSKEVLRDNIRWMRDPRASEPLIEALSDSDAKPADRALAALARLICRFFPDQRALGAVVPKLTDRKQETRSNAISVIGCLRREDALDHLVELLERGTDVDRAQVARQIAGLAYEVPEQMNLHSIEWTSTGKKFWTEKMIAALEDGFPEVRKQAAFALKHFGDRKALPPLEAARRVERDESIAFYMDDAIAALKGIAPDA